MRKRMLARTMAATPFLALMLIAANPASALPNSYCMADDYSDQAQYVPMNDGSMQTRSIGINSASNTWDDWIWRGDLRVCSRSAQSCTLSWNIEKSSSSGWAAGATATLGNASSPSKKWYNFVLGLIPNYSKSTSITTNFDWSTTIRPGQTAQPVQVVVRRWTQGQYQGAYVKGGACTLGLGNAGHQYTWNGNLKWGHWTANERVREFGSIAVDGKV
ncbi:hypothetical protein ACFUEN_07710 [Streptomyces griseorubiginosus]|uniref:hypothetical protein n=1 Tax=Streptomyces griseorubiginosus TaxID=67304 RepID=UPI00363A997E